ncbi:uncharacterized protein KD926_010591 [Aspergillus affinis]|uniref:uncharacterized protein n=1 Tax=Aspergillus affinis TaxID=1070780 RepID=UPI0022FDDD07|nr:uncharacterized protein KD926_010591 [Aspergillus affinis]KAI9038647.1 hypothetical protein KD926_010591 [Aspergillus affinis]
MANISTNKWYAWYLRLVPTGRFTLPPYTTDSNGKIIIHYGEVFCRVEDCAKANHKYTATNNLRTHIKAHDGVPVDNDNKGGRVGQKELDNAIRWYKDLFSGKEPNIEEGTGTAGGGGSSSTAGPNTPNLPRPALPLTKKDGNVHITNMRKLVRNLGHKVPCASCGTAKDCCKNINICDHFLLFNCQNLAPTTNSAQPTTSKAGEEEEA